MLNQYEVPAYLIEELPEILVEFKYMYPSISINKTMQCLANYTSRRVMQNDLNTVKKCFAVAENLHRQGNTIVRVAIERIFVYSFPILVDIWNKEENIELQSIMPMRLHSAYIQQKKKLRI